MLSREAEGDGVRNSLKLDQADQPIEEDGGVVTGDRALNPPGSHPRPEILKGRPRREDQGRPQDSCGERQP